MTLDLILNIKPYSVNAYYYGNRSIKKTEARNWEHSMIELLKPEECQKQLEHLKELFDPKKHCITISILCLYPEEIFFTQKGTISAKTFDVSNVEKPIIDVIFLEKYATTKITNVGIDDKFIIDMHSYKRSYHKNEIRIKIQIENLEYLENNLPI